jgi:hypothetical protein
MGWGGFLIKNEVPAPFLVGTQLVCMAEDPTEEGRQAFPIEPTANPSVSKLPAATC